MVGRRFVNACMALAALLAVTGSAIADNWPNKPVKIIVPFAAGGGTDLFGRILAAALSQRLGQQVYVENRGGANGILGIQTVLAAEADGYTFCVCSDTPLTVNPSLYEKLPYDPVRDLIPIAILNDAPALLVANPTVPAKTVVELVALVKANPDKYSYSSGGAGNFSHLGMALFAAMTNTKMVHVPYKGTGPATVALLTGEAQLMLNLVALTAGHIADGKIKAIAATGAQRNPAFPDLPTVAETLPGFEVTPWTGFFAPKGTPEPIIERLRRESETIIRDPALVAKLTEMQLLPVYYPGEKATARITREIEKWAKVVKSAGIKPQQ